MPLATWAEEFLPLCRRLSPTTLEHHRTGRSVAVTAETNEHVALLNDSIQRARAERGQLGPSPPASMAPPPRSATSSSPKRWRNRWTVASSWTGLVRHSSPADYVRAHVQLGYAATAHGHQGDTVDVSLTLVTPATTHRSLYVGATRGRDENRLCVVTGDDQDARDVLEHVLTNDRVDVPAVAQRRALAEQARGDDAHDRTTAGRERAVARARQDLQDEQRAPELRRLAAAHAALEAAERELRAAQHALRTAPLLRRRGPAERVRTAQAAFAAAAHRHALAARDAAPHTAAVEALRAELERVERELRTARVSERLDRLMDGPVPALVRGRSLGRSR